MRTFLVFYLSFCLIACTASKEKPILNTANLDSHFVTIDANRDTIIRTPKGAAIKIRKGTFASTQELEIKEAYTMKDILLAGLTTESNGRPLRSGGMIYINTRSGDEVVLQKPISVVLPANGIEEGMELFKGEVIGDSINWMETDTLQPTIDENMLKNGKAIFTNQCLTCHNIRKALTGPALANVQSRGPWNELRNVTRWVHNPGAYIPTSRYTRELAAQYNGQIMPSFPQLSEYDIASVLAFIQNESGKVITDTFQLPAWTQQSGITPLDQTTDTSSIGFSYSEERGRQKDCFDTSYVNTADTLNISDDYANDLLSDTLPIANASPLDPLQMQGLRNGFTDAQVSDGAYRFNIQTLGWYNVDAYVTGLPGTTPCELNVQLTGATDINKMNVYAFFPQQKNLSVGNGDGNSKFSFQKIDGKIPLYLKEKGIILAFGNRGNQFYYGISHFNVKPTQTVTLSIQQAAEEELLEAIKNEKIEGINMDVVRQEMVVTPCKSSSGDSVILR